MQYKMLMKEIKDDTARYTLFLDWKSQHCENDYTTRSNLQIQCNSYQITNGIFHRTRTKSSAICRETQKTLNSQTILRRKTNWSNQAPRPQIISQSHSNQDSMAPAQKQKHRSMEQDSKIESPEINITPTVTPPLTKRQEYMTRESLLNKWC